MIIKKVYVTSKGVFWDKSEAEKKKNRVKVYGERIGDLVEREPVRESFVLVEGDQVFNLSEVEVK
jgi:hypothetical protein